MNPQPRTSRPKLVVELPALEPFPAEQNVGFTVINYNTASQTLRCIASLANCHPPPAWILILDNASAEADFDQLAGGLQQAAQSHIQLFRSSTNLGFAAGSNFLVQQLLDTPYCKYLGLLNNDAVAETCLVKLLQAALTDASHPIGMSGGRMHKLHCPQEVDTLGIALYASLMPADRKSATDPYLGPTGGCCLMTRDFIQDITTTTGYFFDERFFCYCEDTDLALRANLLGYRPAYVDDMVALHEGQASSSIAPNHFITYHGLRNTIWMHYKCIPAKTLMRHVHWLLLAHALTVIRQALSGRAGVMLAVYRDSFRQLKSLHTERQHLQQVTRVSPSRWQTFIAPHFYRSGYTAQVVAGWIRSLSVRK